MNFDRVTVALLGTISVTLEGHPVAGKLSTVTVTFLSVLSVLAFSLVVYLQTVLLSHSNPKTC